MAKRIIKWFLVLFFIIGIVACIWNAVTTIIKIIAVLVVVAGFFKTIKSK